MRCAASVFAIGTLLVASCTSVEVETPLQRGVLPEKIGRVGWRCPDDHPIVALHGVAFPPGHPDTPVLVPSPDRCFRSIAEADRAGYPAADPPAGGRLIDDIYLIPTGDDLRADCIRLARSIHLAVACPCCLPMPR